MSNTKISRNLYIHNDLHNAAFSFKKSADGKIADDNRSGLAHDKMACLTFLAFSLEAQANFIGSKVCDDWNEYNPTIKKFKKIFKKGSFEVDWNTRPYSTIKDLKELRDTLAHGKPVVDQIDVPKENLSTPRDIFQYMEGDWEAMLDDEYYNMAYDDVWCIWKTFLETFEIEPIDAITHARAL